MRALGIDVGGSAVKGAIVDCSTGSLTSRAYRVPTPRPARPEALAGAVARIVRHFAWNGRAGVGMPGPIKDGILQLAVNLHETWSGVRADECYALTAGIPMTVVNDADAAGMAEMAFGAGRGERGTVVVVTLGTGIGSAVFHRGRLLPNTELGQFELRGDRAERRAAARVRTARGLSWESYAGRLQEYLEMLEMLLWPDLVVIGGGISAQARLFIPRLHIRARVVPAKMGNRAGIVGAALSASQRKHDR